jgi:DNA-binding transcriptional regulator YdaS (Cro superfamily)
MVAKMAIAAYLTEHGLTDAELANQVGVSAELVRLWRHGRRTISAKRAVVVSRVTGIPRHELRPDLWEPPESAPTPESAPRRRKRVTAAAD